MTFLNAASPHPKAKDALGIVSSFSGS